MNRFQSYQKQAVLNILLSKFVYTRAKEITKIKRTIISTIPKNKEPEIAVLVFAILFSRQPNISRAEDRRSKSYKLSQIKLTARSKSLAHDLHVLTNNLLPFQLENEEYKVKTSLHQEFNWNFANCRPSTHFNSFLFNYILNEDTFDVSVNVKFSKNLVYENIFLLRLFQLPLESFSSQKTNEI